MTMQKLKTRARAQTHIIQKMAQLFFRTANSDKGTTIIIVENRG